RKQPGLAAVAIDIEPGVELAIADVLSDPDHHDQRPGQAERDHARDHRQHDHGNHEVPPARGLPVAHHDRTAHEREREPAEDPPAHPRLEPPGAPAALVLAHPLPHLAFGLEIVPAPAALLPALAVRRAARLPALVLLDVPAPGALDLGPLL